MSVMIIVTALACRAELGSIVAEEHFPSWPREEHILRNQILLLGNRKMLCLRSKTYLLPGHKFYVRNICFPV